MFWQIIGKAIANSVTAANQVDESNALRQDAANGFTNNDGPAYALYLQNKKAKEGGIPQDPMKGGGTGGGGGGSGGLMGFMGGGGGGLGGMGGQGGQGGQGGGGIGLMDFMQLFKR